jgi:hypothetical protein
VSFTFAMKAVLFALGLLLEAMCLCCHAQADELQSAVASFPQIWARVYNPQVAVQYANILIQAGEKRACAALLKAVENRRGDDGERELVSMQACHLCRLLFTSTNSSKPLRRPKLGSLQGVPAESISRDPPEWPDLPFVIVDGIPLSLTDGYAGSGVPELAERYLGYCRANGRFRTNLFAIPTTITASNALVSVFASPAWKSLGRKDETWSFYGNEHEAEKSLWAQINNVANKHLQPTPR